MARRYDFAMNRHAKGRKKQKKDRLDGLDFQTMGVFKESKSSAIVEDENMREMITPDTNSAESKWPELDADLAAPIMAEPKSDIGDEFGGITDRISKLLQDYESMYEDPEKQSLAVMQEQITGQMNVENLLSDYTRLCSEREELLNSLQDSLDVDEEEMLDELEAFRKEHNVDVEAAETSIRETFQNVKTTSEKLKNLNKHIIDLSRDGEQSERLESEKKQLERELQMYKKMASQQRRDIYQRRPSMTRKQDEKEQWKMVAGEMVDILKTVRHTGKLDRESLEKELKKILMALNTQTEYIENLKRDLSKQEKTAKNIEKEKNRVNNEKVLVEDELETKRHELRQCKQYLRKILSEKKEQGDKIRFEGAEINLEEDAGDGKLGKYSDGKSTVDILQAQLRDSRQKVFKTEEDNRDLQRKIEALMASKDKQIPTELVPIADEVQIPAVELAKPGVCPSCQMYKSQLSNVKSELKEKTEHVQRLKDDLSSHKSQLKKAQKKSLEDKKLPVSEGNVKPTQESKGSTTGRTEDSLEIAKDVSPESESPVEEEDVTEVAVPGRPEVKSTAVKKSKPQAQPKSPKKRKKVPKDKGKEREEPSEHEVKTKTSQKLEDRHTSRMRHEMVLGECREEKAAYVKVREAKMMTLCDKGTQTAHYGRLASLGAARRESVAYSKNQHRRSHALAEAVLSLVSPTVLEQETVSTVGDVQEEVDRLCNNISELMEYIYDIIQQEVKSIQLVAETNLREQAADLFTPGTMMDRTKLLKGLPHGDFRRQSLAGHTKRRGTMFQLDPRRGSILHRDSRLQHLGHGDKKHTDTKETGEEPGGTSDVPNTESRSENDVTQNGGTQNVTEETPGGISAVKSGIPEVRVNTLFADDQPQKTSETGGPSSETAKNTGATVVFEEDFISKSKWSTLPLILSALRAMKGGGCSHVLSEIKSIAEPGDPAPVDAQARDQITIMAQHAVDILQATGQVLMNHLNDQLGIYRRFYELWDKLREKARRTSMSLEKKEDFAGKQISRQLSQVLSIEEASILVTENSDEKIAEEDSGHPLIPPITSRIPVSKRGMAISTAGVSKTGGLMIAGSGPLTVQPSTSNFQQQRRRGKPRSQKHLMNKQKALLEKVLHVNTKMDDLRHMLTGASVNHRSIPLGSINSSMAFGAVTQNVETSLMTSSINLPSLANKINHQGHIDPHLQFKAKDLRSPPEDPQPEFKLPGMNLATNTMWDRKQSVVPALTSIVHKKIPPKNSKEGPPTKLPTLTISNILEVT